jgi:hypothetical protein
MSRNACGSWASNKYEPAFREGTPRRPMLATQAMIAKHLPVLLICLNCSAA